MGCKQPTFDATFRISNANIALGRVGGYPIEKSPSLHDLRSTVDEHGLEVFDENAREAMWAHLEPNIAFWVGHPGCIPGEDLTTYEFWAPPRLDSYLGKVLHLDEKTWMGRTDLMRMIEFWWTHKGEETPDVVG